MKYRVLYLGIKPIGEKCFRYLIEREQKNIELKAIVSNESKDTVWWKSNRLYQYALNNGMPFLSSEKRNNEGIIKLIQENDVNCIISNGYNWIISKEVLEQVEYCAFNLHLAILPDYQGNFTYNHAILNGEKEYGITLHWMTEQVDQGEYIFMPRFPIDRNSTTKSLYEKSVNLGEECFAKLIDMMEENTDIPRHPMNGEGHFYNRKSLDGLRKIVDLNDSEEVDRKSRAFFFPPFESAYTIIHGKKYYIVPSETV